MNKSLSLLLLISFILFSCATGPYVYNTDPGSYEDGVVKVTPVIGVNVYSIIIENKSEFEVFVDFERMSVISPYGESRDLLPVSFDNHIPPASRIIIQCNQKSFSNHDPFSSFINIGLNGMSNTNSTYYTEKDIMELHFGNKIRLYIPMIINGNEIKYDLIFNLNSIYE